MRFLADTNITQTVISNLRLSGHNVLDIKKQNPKISDVEIIKTALKEERIILTHDKDFEALVVFPKYQVGVIKISLRIQNSLHFWKKLKDLLEHQTEEKLTTSLTIITEESAILKSYRKVTG